MRSTASSTTNKGTRTAGQQGQTTVLALSGGNARSRTPQRCKSSEARPRGWCAFRLKAIRESRGASGRGTAAPERRSVEPEVHRTSGCRTEGFKSYVEESQIKTPPARVAFFIGRPHGDSNPGYRRER